MLMMNILHLRLDPILHAFDSRNELRDFTDRCMTDQREIKDVTESDLLCQITEK